MPLGGSALRAPARPLTAAPHPCHHASARTSGPRRPFRRLVRSTTAAGSIVTYRATPNAIAAYATARGLSERAGGEELLRLAALAKPSEDGRKLRYRNRADRLDVTMNLANGCIVAVTVRGYAPKSGWQARKDRGEE